jgi:hypothetical protein
MDEIKGVFGSVFFFFFHDAEGFPGESGAIDILWIEDLAHFIAREAILRSTTTIHIRLEHVSEIFIPIEGKRGIPFSVISAYPRVQK